METYEYKNLTELLLTVIRNRPGMYLRTAQIKQLPNFILGYQFSNNISQAETDFYFGDNGFLVWYTEKYKPAAMSCWHDYFLAETNDDEYKALELYFTRLEEYHSWYNLTVKD